MKAIIVLSFEIDEDKPEQVLAILKALDPPQLPHFAGDARIAIAEVASSVLTYLDGADDGDKLPKVESMWINAFTLVRPSDETLLEVGRAVVQSLRIPGQTIVKVSAT